MLSESWCSALYIYHKLLSVLGGLFWVQYCPAEWGCYLIPLQDKGFRENSKLYEFQNSKIMWRNCQWMPASTKDPGLLSQGAVSMPFRREIQLLGKQPGSHPAQHALWGRHKYFTLWGCFFGSWLFPLPTRYVSPSLSGSETSVTRERSHISIHS